MLTGVMTDSASFGAAIRVESLKRTGDKAEGQGPVSQDVDHALVERARQGDLEAFRDLFYRYQNRAKSIAIGVVGSKEDAEDVVQEAFLKAYRNLHSFRGQSTFYTWFYRIVFNLAIDTSRKRYRHSESSIGEHSTIDALAHHSDSSAGDFIANVATPDEALRRGELKKNIEAALESLSPEHRAVIVLREVQGLSYSEISDVVGCSKGTVMSRLHHARKRLQKTLADFADFLPLRAGRRVANGEQDFQEFEEDETENSNELAVPNVDITERRR